MGGGGIRTSDHKLEIRIYANLLIKKNLRQFFLCQSPFSFEISTKLNKIEK